jgi:uroporphyrinogen-III decarboxylase
MTSDLTALERLENTIEGKKVDRLPIVVLTKMFGLRQLNVTLADCMKSSADLYVKTQWHCVKELGHEALWAYSGLLEMNEMLDPTTVRVTEDDRFVQRWYLESIEDVRSLPEVEVKTQGKIPWVIDIIRKLKWLSENLC